MFNEQIKIRELQEGDWEDILYIFNYFAKNSFAAYNEYPYELKDLKRLTEQVSISLILEEDKKVIGFGYVSSYKPYPNFNHTGVLTYFIMPGYTGKGLGTKLFDELIRRGREAGITNYLAHVSSKNEQSLSFHKKHGFEEAGRFKKAAYKFGCPIDIVWFQKEIN